MFGAGSGQTVNWMAVEFHTRIDCHAECYFECYFSFTALWDTATVHGAREDRAVFLVVGENWKEGDRDGVYQ